MKLVLTLVVRFFDGKKLFYICFFA